MKPRLTEHSERKSLAECEPALISQTSRFRMCEAQMLERADQFTPYAWSKISAGFNSPRMLRFAKQSERGELKETTRCTSS